MSGCNEVGQFGLTVVINYTHNPANERKVDFPTVNRRWGMMQDSFQPPYSSESSSGNRESCSPDQRATSLEICAVPELFHVAGTRVPHWLWAGAGRGS